MNQLNLRCFRTYLIAGVILMLTAIPTATAQGDAKSIEKKTKVHRLATTNRAPYDAFVYINRIPDAAEKGESADDLAGRIFGRLANQEGRVLVKLPSGMDRDAYLAFKTFFRYQAEGNGSVGNCAACHTPSEFTDFQKHIVTKDGSPQPTPSLRNLRRRNVDIEKAIKDKIASINQRRSGEANEIDDAYAKMTITNDDLPGLVKFLNQLNDVEDSDFRKLILGATLLDTSVEIE